MTEKASEREPTTEELALYKAKAENELSQAEEHKALALKAQNEAWVAELEAKGAEYNLVGKRINADEAAEKRQKALTADEHHHIYQFTGEVNGSSVKTAIKQLVEWDRLAGDRKLDIEFQINSPGGDIIDGFALFDVLRNLSKKGHNITTVAYGMAASMGGVLLEAGDTRVMGENSVLLLHEASFGAVGSYGAVEDRLKLVDIFHDRILDIFATHSKVSKNTIKSNWKRKDWWISASDSVFKYGFADEIR